METTLKISGMTCNHCAMSVTKALKGVAGVEKVEVSLDRGQATVSGSAIRERLIEAVKEEGYEAF